MSGNIFSPPNGAIRWGYLMRSVSENATDGTDEFRDEMF